MLLVALTTTPARESTVSISVENSIRRYWRSTSSELLERLYRRAGGQQRRTGFKDAAHAPRLRPALVEQGGLVR